MCKKSKPKHKPKSSKTRKVNKPELFYAIHPDYTCVIGPMSVKDIVDQYIADGQAGEEKLSQVLIFPQSTTKKLKVDYTYSLQKCPYH